jgi:hypothetical protein
MSTRSGSLTAFGVLLALLFSTIQTSSFASEPLGFTFPSGSQNFSQLEFRSVATVSGVTPAVTGDPSGAVIQVTVSSSQNLDRLRLQSASGVTAAGGLTLSDFDSTSTGLSEIVFKGSKADVSAALSSLQLKRGSSSTSTISVSVMDGEGVVYGGHLYELKSPGLGWKAGTTPLAAAATFTSGTCTGYLVSITSAEEQAAVQTLVTSSAWIGASDAGRSVNDFAWLAGPEAGTALVYDNWGGVEPNNFMVGDGTTDDYAIMAANGLWSDTTYGTYSYLVEYGDGSCSPEISAATASFTAESATVPSAPQQLSISYPSFNSALVKWEAPGSNGGAAISGYVVEYEVGGEWIALTPSSLSATISGVRVENAWSFRVAAANSVGTGGFASLANVPAPPYLGPMLTLGQMVVSGEAGERITFAGVRLDQVTGLRVEGKNLTLFHSQRSP